MAVIAFWLQATLAVAAGTIGIPQASGSNFTASVTKAYLYNRITWGGLWGFIFLVPWKQSWWVRGLVFSVGPSLATFLIFFPRPPAGLFGLELGASTPLLVLANNGVWGLATAWWLEYFVAAKPAAA